MDLSIIIVNWNSASFVRQCLSSVFQNTEGLSFEVIVIDSGSFDDCGAMINRDFPQVKFIQSSKRIGFAEANNLAFRHSIGRCVLFLNPDTELLGSAIGIMYEQVQKLPRAGAVGCRLLNSDRTIQTSCIQSFPTIANQVFDAEVLRKYFPRARLWGTAPLYAKSKDPIPVEGISGACLMTLRTVFEQVGGFSEDYFMYYEDMDFCLKVRKAGLKNYYVPRAEIVHHGGKSSRMHTELASIMMAESAWRFFLKNHGRSSAAVFRFCLAAKAISRSCLLAFARPLAWPEPRRQRINSAFRKWTCVARWAFGSERAGTSH